MLVARGVRAWAKKARVRHVAGFEGFAAPENLTGEIARFKPSHVLLVDAAHLGKVPGAVEVLDVQDITGVSFSTHMLPAPIFMGYLEKTANCRAMIVGIEPVQKDVMGPISPVVAGAIEAVVETIRQAMGRAGHLHIG